MQVSLIQLTANVSSHAKRLKNAMKRPFGIDKLALVNVKRKILKANLIFSISKLAKTHLLLSARKSKTPVQKHSRVFGITVVNAENHAIKSVVRIKLYLLIIVNVNVVNPRLVQLITPGIGNSANVLKVSSVLLAETSVKDRKVMSGIMNYVCVSIRCLNLKQSVKLKSLRNATSPTSGLCKIAVAKNSNSVISNALLVRPFIQIIPALAMTL